MKRALGVCYYPEHWSEEIWHEDAKRMKEMGLTYVRIGEFSWSKLEPVEGQLDFEWLDNAIEILGQAGLKVVLGTPTAAPPRWMIDKYPDMLAVHANGHSRKFGSRRHYCFSHEGYKRECVRIVELLAKRYGKNQFISAWQTDNEYSCHDTAISYSEAAKKAFQNWLRETYPCEETAKENHGDIDLLNKEWGNIFWSMEYQSFDQIELPNLTVTEPNPSHTLAFRRFSSHQIVCFNKLQTEIIRKFSNASITHNYMGRITDFDHFAVGEDLDFASWDSYPLGFLEDRITASDEHKRQFAKQGDPDFQSFHHDLYRAVGKGRLWVMEQQPGPVNWAPHNPAPLPGMVRLWAWEAFARGAEAICFFRWRQLPFAQEQMHSGLLRPDSSEAECVAEVKQIAQEIEKAPQVNLATAPVAIVFDYDSDFAWATQPHGKGLNYFDLVFEYYKALRSLGLSVDILPKSTLSFDAYELVLAPGLIHMDDALKEALAATKAQVIIGPRSAARTKEMHIPVPLPPNISRFNCKVTSVESIREDMSIALDEGGCIKGYREIIESDCVIHESTLEGDAVMVGKDNLYYIAAWLDHIALRRILKKILDEKEPVLFDLPDGVRILETKNERFWFNYDNAPHQIGDVKLKPISMLRQEK